MTPAPFQRGNIDDLTDRYSVAPVPKTSAEFISDPSNVLLTPEGGKGLGDGKIDPQKNSLFTPGLLKP